MRFKVSRVVFRNKVQGQQSCVWEQGSRSAELCPTTRFKVRRFVSCIMRMLTVITTPRISCWNQDEDSDFVPEVRCLYTVITTPATFMPNSRRGRETFNPDGCSSSQPNHCKITFTVCRVQGYLTLCLKSELDVYCPHGFGPNSTRVGRCSPQGERPSPRPFYCHTKQCKKSFT